jgi:hypothetical protein
VKTVASKFARVYGKRGILLAIAVLAAVAGAKGHVPYGFFDGG